MRKRRSKIPAGKVERGERKQTADEVSKRDKTMPKPGGDPSSGISLGDALRLPKRHQARALWSTLADRFATCRLILHPEKTKIVYCKDANRRGDFGSARR